MSQREFHDQDQQRGRKDSRHRNGRSAALTGGFEVLQHIEVTAQVVPAQRTLVEIAQSMQPCTSFACFAYDGQGATLYLDTASMIFEHQGEKLAVVEADDKRLVGVFIWFCELRKLAEAGETKYRPKIDTVWREDLENKRAYILTSLLEAISTEGGHQGVMAVMQSLRAAAELREAMASKSQNLFEMFDKEGTHTFHVEIGNKPMVFRSGHFKVPSWKGRVKSDREVFGIKLLTAPVGAPNDAYKVGGYVVLEHLFSNTPPTNEVGAMMTDLIGLFEAEGKLEEVKAAVIAIGGVTPECMTAVEQIDNDAPGSAAEAANERAMHASVHGPSPVAQAVSADLVAHAAMVEAEINGVAIIH